MAGSARAITTKPVWAIGPSTRRSSRKASRASSIASTASRWISASGWSPKWSTPIAIYDEAGLGDWTVNPKKFPQGLKGLIDRVHSLKMDFGLWVEPEMVNANSDLYRAHPDWVINFPERPRTELRTQMVLNLARNDV